MRQRCSHACTASTREHSRGGRVARFTTLRLSRSRLPVVSGHDKPRNTLPRCAQQRAEIRKSEKAPARRSPVPIGVPVLGLGRGTHRSAVRLDLSSMADQPRKPKFVGKRSARPTTTVSGSILFASLGYLNRHFTLQIGKIHIMESVYF
jgi:hypothetical protein